MQPLPPYPAPDQPPPPVPPPPVATMPAAGPALGDAWSSGGGGSGPRAPQMPQVGGRWKLVAAGLAVVVVATGIYVVTRPKKHAPVAQVQTTALRLAWKAGDTHRFQFDIDAAVTGSVKSTSVQLNDKFEGIMVWHVVSVDDQGVAHVTINATQVGDTTNGRVIREPDKTFHVLIGPDGHLLTDPGFGTTGAKGNDGPAMPGVDQILPLLPGAPVPVGHAWKTTFEQTNPYGKGSTEFDATSTLSRFENVNGTNAQVVSTTATLPIDLTIYERTALAGTGQSPSVVPKGQNPLFTFSGKVDFAQTAWLDGATSSLLKSTTTGEIVLNVRVSGVPRSELPPGGVITFAGTLTFHLESV